MSVESKPISQLQISEFNVRKERGDVSELAKSIKEKGILQPLLVRPEDSKFGIIIGSRRYSAAKLAKLMNVPVIIKNLDDDASLEVSLIENVQRGDVTTKEASQAIIKLLQHYSVRQLADKLGMSSAYVHQMRCLDSKHFLTRLENAGVEIKLRASRDETTEGKAIPTWHAVAVVDAFNKPDVAKTLEDNPQRDIEFSKAVADLTTKQAQKATKILKENPMMDIDIIIEKAKEKEPSGGGGFGGGGTSEGHVDSETKLWHNKLIYNLERNTTKYDFYTIGYSGTEIDLFIERLKTKDVKTVIDVRKNPYSLYKQDFSKDKLSQSLKAKGISYEHFPEFGVEKEEREDLQNLEDYERLWKSYDKKIIPTLPFLEGFLEYEGKKGPMEGPLVFMCSELDPTKCHRHRIAKAYKDDFDLKSMDL
jgi:ParB/RepB/Spo0J family partition protein